MRIGLFANERGGMADVIPFFGAWFGISDFPIYCAASRFDFPVYRALRYEFSHLPRVTLCSPSAIGTHSVPTFLILSLIPPSYENSYSTVPFFLRQSIERSLSQDSNVICVCTITRGLLGGKKTVLFVQLSFLDNFYSTHICARVICTFHLFSIL